MPHVVPTGLFVFCDNCWVLRQGDLHSDRIVVRQVLRHVYLLLLPGLVMNSTYAACIECCKLLESSHVLLVAADKLMGHAIETVMMAVGSGSAPTSRSCSVKVMFVAWAIFCVIMLSAYTANLTANLTVNQIGVTIKSLSDLAQLPVPFGVPAESSVSAYFANSSDQGARSLRPKMMEFRDPAQAVEAVRDGKISAYINDYPTVQFFTQVMLKHRTAEHLHYQHTQLIHRRGAEARRTQPCYLEASTDCPCFARATIRHALPIPCSHLHLVTVVT